MERNVNSTVEDLRPTIIPKSDQLNSEQLLGGPMTVTVTEVRLGSSEEQPVVVHYEGENGRPFKPCKTMRKVLIHAWGADGREWVGRSMTLYNDPSVKFGGEDVGGIRISHMTDIERDIKVSLTSTRGKKAKYEIRRLESLDAQALSAIRNAETAEKLKETFGRAWKAAGQNQARRAALKQAYDMRMAALAQTDTTPTGDGFNEQAFAKQIAACTSVDTLDLLADELRDIADDAVRTRLTEAYKARSAEIE